MANLKDLRARIGSVKNTRKITSAMKMVAAAKLRRAQEQAESARPYAVRLERMLGELAGSLSGQQGAPKLLAGTGQTQTHLIVLATADRGLCGGFNANLVRDTRRLVQDLQKQGKQIKILCVGRKGYEALKREFGDMIIDHLTGLCKPKPSYADAELVCGKILALFEKGEFDVCTLVYNRFQSAITQIVTRQQIIPFAADSVSNNDNQDTSAGAKAGYEFEPAEEQILAELLPQNVGMQIFKAFLENAASEHGARMSAMDSATRNAGDLIDKLTLTYNRQRQAAITSELIEIISGAEAL